MSPGALIDIFDSKDYCHVSMCCLGGEQEHRRLFVLKSETYISIGVYDAPFKN
jgi:hypothetical protein